MTNFTQRLQILSSCVLIDTLMTDGAYILPNGYYSTDVQLRQAKDGFWMTSPITGNHFIPSPDGIITDRVKAHWEGFKYNQPKMPHIWK